MDNELSSNSIEKWKFNLTDLPHLRILQRELWQLPRARVALMIGAGFSVNSEPIAGINTNFPTWNELVSAMFEEIYPRTAGEDLNKRKGLFKSMNELKIASEYEALFGSEKLELLIRNTIPDLHRQPGELHRLLLNLPWVDVFTLNYDSLLERTENIERAYTPVRNSLELQTAFSPRIIKLHGSFDTKTKLIITEEDFRTYPNDFAPFVNTVRQSLLENSLVLLGFSGDDPNFLSWIGWVRDELGHRHAPIYLVGPLGLTVAKRKLLEHRNIVPIDLAALFADDSLKYQNSLEWFLKSLGASKPPSSQKWPNIHQPKAEITSGGVQVLLPEPEIPIKVPVPLPSIVLSSDTVDQLLARWKYERSHFPGWIVAPESKRQLLWLETGDWGYRLIQEAENWNWAEQIVIFNELFWRLSTAMVPIPSMWRDVFEKAVDGYYGELEKNTLVPSRWNDSLNATTSCWLQISLGLLQSFREAHESKPWQALRAKVDLIAAKIQQLDDRLPYEDALLALSEVDRPKAKEILRKWTPSDSNPRAALQKASLLLELSEKGEAELLLRNALFEIRRSQQRQKLNIHLLSLEGWCTFQLYFLQGKGTDKNSLSDFNSRWHELKAWDCSPLQIISELSTSLDNRPQLPTWQTTKVKRTFDPGRITVSQTFTNNGDDKFLPAFAAIRLNEAAGVSITCTTRILEKACHFLDEYRPLVSVRLSIRLGSDQQFRDEISLGRANVANMDLVTANELIQWTSAILERESACLFGGSKIGDVEKRLIRVLIEVLSRLAIKLDSKNLESNFEQAIVLHNLPLLRLHFWLNDVTGKWFLRLFTAAPDSILIEWLPKLLALDAYDTACDSLGEECWPDPLSFFPFDRIKNMVVRDGLLKKKIRAEIKRTISLSEAKSGIYRERLLSRLVNLYDCSLIDKNDRLLLQRTLWQDISEDQLPVFKKISFRTIIELAPNRAKSINAIKTAILRTPATQIPAIDLLEDGKFGFKQGWPMTPDFVFMANSAAQSQYSKKGKGEAGTSSVGWTERDAQHLFKKLVDWATFIEPFAGANMFILRAEDKLCVGHNASLFLVNVIFPKVKFTAAFHKKLMALVDQLERSDIFLFEILPYSLILDLEAAEPVSQRLKAAFESENLNAIHSSGEALRRWIALSTTKHVPQPSRELITLLIQSVAFRSNRKLEFCISLTTFLIAEFPKAIDLENISLLVTSLSAWLNLWTDKSDTSNGGGYSIDESIELQQRLGRLAGALTTWFDLHKKTSTQPLVLDRWKSFCFNSSLPEIQRSFEDGVKLSLST